MSVMSRADEARLIPLDIPRDISRRLSLAVFLKLRLSLILGLFTVLPYLNFISLAAAKSPSSQRPTAQATLNESQLADSLLELLASAYPLSAPQDSPDEVKRLIMDGVRAEASLGVRPVDSLGATRSLMHRGELFKRSYDLWRALPKASPPLNLSADHIQRLSRQLFKRSSQSKHQLKQITKLGLTSARTKVMLVSGLLDGSYALGLENLARMAARRGAGRNVRRTALQETALLLHEAERQLLRLSKRGDVVSGEQYVIIQLGLAICYLKLESMAKAQEALTALLIIPSPGESLLDLRDLTNSQVKSAKAFAFDVQRRRGQDKIDYDWVGPFSDLAEHLTRWAEVKRRERSRLRALKAGARDHLVRSPSLKRWWRKRGGSIRSKLQRSERALALQQLVVAIGATAQRRQGTARHQVDLEWIQLPAGALWVADSQDPSRALQVNFKEPFLIAKTEVTLSQYQRCVEAGACEEPHWEDCMLWSGRAYQRGAAPKSFRESQRPVVCVTWSQARSFAQWVGGDLPTESEWMYAAQSAGRGTTFPWGEAPATCEFSIMNEGSDGCGQQRTWDVCSRPLGESEQGVCDLAGNVWEWVLDEGEARGASVRLKSDGSARCDEVTCDSPTRPHIVKGGGWGSGAQYLKTTARVSFTGDHRHLFLGFRPVLRGR